MSDTARKRLILVARMGITLVFAWLVLRSVDLAQLRAVLGGVEAFGLVAGLALYAASGVPVALRWRVMLEADGVPVSSWFAIRATYGGFLYTTALPGGVGGDLYRGSLIHPVLGAGGAAINLIAERLLGIHVLAAMALVGVLGAQVFAGPVMVGATTTLVLVCVGGVVLFVPGLADLPARALQAAAATRVARRAHGVAAQARRYRDHYPTLTVATLAGNLLAVVGVGFLDSALGIGSPALVLLAACPLGWIAAAGIPSLGGFGPREGVLAWVLVQGGAGSDEAAAVALLAAVGVVVRALVGGALILGPTDAPTGS